MKPLLALCALFLLPAAHAATLYGRTQFRDDVSVGAWSAISSASITTTNGGTYTNGVYTNYYRITATNYNGRIPLSTNLSLTFSGATNHTNAVFLSWTRYEGITRYVVERSYDAGTTWTNHLTVSASSSNWTDTGTNSWTAGSVTSSVALIQPPDIDFSNAGTVTVKRIFGSPQDTNSWVVALTNASGLVTNWLLRYSGAEKLASEIGAASGYATTSALGVVSGLVVAIDADLDGLADGVEAGVTNGFLPYAGLPGRQPQVYAGAAATNYLKILDHDGNSWLQLGDDDLVDETTVAMGYGATATNGGTAVGGSAAASLQEGVAVGEGAAAAQISVAAGAWSASAAGGIAIGYSSLAGTYGTAVGYDAEAGSFDSLALGYDAVVKSGLTNTWQFGSGSNGTINTWQINGRTFYNLATGLIPTNRMAADVVLAGELTAGLAGKQDTVTAATGLVFHAAGLSLDLTNAHPGAAAVRVLATTDGDKLFWKEDATAAPGSGITNVIPGTGLSGALSGDQYWITNTVAGGTGLTNLIAGAGVSLAVSGAQAWITNTFGTAIDGSELVDGSVSNVDLASGIDAAKLTTGNVAPARITTALASLQNDRQTNQISVTSSGTQAIPPSTWTKLTLWDTEATDPDNIWDGQNMTFEAVGYVSLWINQYMNTLSDGKQAQVAVYKNGASQGVLVQVWKPVTGGAAIAGPVLFRNDSATNVFTFWAYHNDAATNTWGGTTDNFAGFLETITY